jgi:hypothetical protein
MVLLVILFLVSFTIREDKPWWGLVNNPTVKNGVGTTWTSIMSEFGENGSKLDEFHRMNKRTPRTFKEFDTLSQGGILHVEKTGTVAAKESAILYQHGYDSDHYSVIYQDGSSCEFYLVPGGFVQTCTRRDYWAWGRLVQEEPFINTEYK